MTDKQIKPKGCLIGKDEFGKDFIAYCGCVDCINRSEALLDLRKGYLEKINKITDLEKENAELKEKLEIEQNARIDWFGKAVTKDRQLTEAKEIIKMYYLYNPSSEYSYEEIDQKAETFFNEV